MTDKQVEAPVEDEVVDLGNEVSESAEEDKEKESSLEQAVTEESGTEVDEVSEAPAKAAKAAKETVKEVVKDTGSSSKDSGLIPRHRFNYAQEKRRAAEERADSLAKELEALRSSSTPPPETPDSVIAKLEDRAAELDLAIEDARADADRVKLTKLRREQREIERKLTVMAVPAPPDPEVSTREAVEQVAVKEVVRELEATYDVLNEAHEKYDADLTDEIMTMFDALRVKMPRADALRKASTYVLKAHDIVAPKAKVVRNVESRKRNLAAADAQPPDLSKTGMESDKAGVSKSLDIMHMTQEEFEKLGDREIAKLLEGS